MKNFLILIIVTIIFLSNPGRIFASSGDFLIINQVRGDEVCCQKGTDDLISAVDSSPHSFPVAWALRFDALNEKYIKPISIHDEIGLLLEITPSLASESGVSYKGAIDGSDWYSAKNTFLIGYTQGQRKKILDTLFTRFKNIFGYYPHFTVSWMIDSWSLNYIHDQFGVELHELTKEQYETDSYTLYGSIFNYPYYPSINYPLIPGIDDQKMDLIIIRQTISDTLKNYGSAKSYFTSQPNDYLSYPQNPKDYFNQLLKNMLDQKNHKFGLIGFENSFSEKKYISEFISQLNQIQTLASQNKLHVYSPKEYIEKFKKENSKNNSFYLEKDFFTDTDTGALWYFGKNYRARFIKKDENIVLDDFRIFDQNLNDPYIKTPASLDYAYWITPYVFDGSQMFGLSSSDHNNLKNLKIPDEPVAPDYLTHPFGLIFKTDTPKLQGTADLEINLSTGGSIILKPDEIIFSHSSSPSFSPDSNLTLSSLFQKNQKIILDFKRQLPLFIQSKGNRLYLGWKNGSKEITLAQVINNKSGYELIPVTKDIDYSALSPILQPDRSSLPFDPAKSIIYWHNQEAVTGRNPVRVFILPRNKLERPAYINKLQVRQPDGNPLHIDYPKDYYYHLSPWFIDITSKVSGSFKIDILLNGKKLATQVPVKFVPDCSQEFKKCIQSPFSLIDYAQVLTGEKMRGFIDHLKNNPNPPIKRGV